MLHVELGNVWVNSILNTDLNTLRQKKKKKKKRKKIDVFPSS